MYWFCRAAEGLTNRPAESLFPGNVIFMILLVPKWRQNTAKLGKPLPDGTVSAGITLWHDLLTFPERFKLRPPVWRLFKKLFL